MEKWRILEGQFNNYAVSNIGNVKNIKTGKILKNFSTEEGYIKVSLCQNNKKATFPVHRLVALYFIPNKFSLPCVNHKDGNKHNNTVENLEWCSHSYNTCHAQNNGLKKDMHPLKLIDLTDNSEYYFQSISQAANFIGVNKSNLSRALKRETNIYHNFQIIRI